MTTNADGNVVSVVDAHGIFEGYLALCALQHGVDDPPVIVLGKEVTK